MRVDAPKVVNYTVLLELLGPSRVLSKTARQGRIVRIPTRHVRRIVKRYAKLVGIED